MFNRLLRQVRQNAEHVRYRPNVERESDQCERLNRGLNLVERKSDLTRKANVHLSNNFLNEFPANTDPLLYVQDVPISRARDCFSEQ